MKLKLVVIDLETPAWLRKVASVAVPVVAFAVAGAVFATPKQWAPMQALTSADLNALTVMNVNGVKYSVGATHYCGVGPVSTMGAFTFGTPTKTGFAAAKAMCEVGCSSPTAHMCDAAEIARSKQLGDTLTGGWYSTQAFADATGLGGTYSMTDCNDWTYNGTATNIGGSTLIGFSGTVPNVGPCGGTEKVMCCD